MSEKKNNPALKKSLARLMAVQALYSRDVSGEDEADFDADSLIDLCRDSMRELELEGVKPDKKFFKDLAKGAVEKNKELDGQIEKYLASGWTIDKIGSLLRAILRAAIYEISEFKETPAKVVISEYLNITRSFFGEEKPKEAGFVNAILDNVVKKKV